MEDLKLKEEVGFMAHRISGLANMIQLLTLLTTMNMVLLICVLALLIY